MTTVNIVGLAGGRRIWRQTASLLLATMSTLGLARNDILSGQDDPSSSVSVLASWSSRARELETELSHDLNRSTQLTLAWIGSRDEPSEPGEPAARIDQWSVGIDRAVVRLAPRLIWAIGAEYEYARERPGDETETSATAQISSAIGWTSRNEQWWLGVLFNRERTRDTDGRAYLSEATLELGRALTDELALTLELKRDNDKGRSSLIELEADYFDPWVLLAQIGREHSHTLYAVGFKLEF